jgi:adenylate cyclase
VERAENFRGRPIGDLILRGRTEPLRAYEPLTEAGSSDLTTATYASAFAKLEAGDPSAMPAFAALLSMRADDCLASFHLKRLLNGSRGTKIVME